MRIRSTAKSMTHGRGAYAETPYGRMYFETEGAGPAVFVVPGGPGVGHAHYHPWFSGLADAHTVVYFDHLGTGRSDRLADPNQYTVAVYTEAIDALRAHLEVEAISLIGLSFGGMPAIQYALQHGAQLRRLVLSNAQLSGATWQEGNIDNLNHELRNQFPEVWAQILDLRARGVLSTARSYQQLLDSAVAGMEWVDPNVARMLRSDAAEGFELAVYEAFVGPDPEWEVAGTLAGFDPTPSLRGLETPTLVITGRHDRLTPPRIARVIHDALPATSAELVVCEQSAHRPWVEEAEAYFELVRAFLR
jgi:proline iminopeptidase